MEVGKQDAESWLELESAGGEAGSLHRYGSAGEDGLVTFRLLPAGTYRLARREGSGAGEMTVTVPASGPVRFAPTRMNALRVTVDDPSSAMARAGLQTGDLVIGIDNMEFRNAMHIQALLFGAMAKSRVTLIVLRKGARMEIPVEPARLMSLDGPIGGDFTPTSR